MRSVGGSNISSMLNEVLRDVVILEKKTGERVEDIKASVSTGEIMIGDATLPAEDGDMILRELPNGFTERYTILDVGFHTGLRGIPSSFQMKVQKESSIRTGQSSVTNNYNLHGANTRVNIGSTDNSYNAVDASSESLFADLRKVILAIENENEKAILLQSARELEAAQKTPSFIQKYQDFVQQGANHITLLGPFLPALTQFLMR